jgi:lipoate-protein ligase A
MAYDESLLTLAAERKLPILRAYRWSDSWISLGYFQSWELIAPTLPSEVEAVRRLTGGGIVDHRKDQTYSLLIPRSEELSSRLAMESYAQIHRCIADTLCAQGAPAELAPRSVTPPAAGWCFSEAPVPADLISKGRKIGGAAQRRTRAGLIHQGSLQVAVPVDWNSLAKKLGSEVLTLQPGEAEGDTAMRIAREKYGTDEWLRLR